MGLFRFLGIPGAVHGAPSLIELIAQVRKHTIDEAKTSSEDSQKEEKENNQTKSAL